MDGKPPIDEKLLECVEVRLSTWKRLWVFFLVAYFLLGTSSVALSAMAATKIMERWAPQFSVAAAVCVAVLGFLRPEARYRNLIRAWRELTWEKERYLFGAPGTEPLLSALRRTERLATEDEAQGNPPESKNEAKNRLNPPRPEQRPPS